MKLAVLTSGGDAPGMNAALRAVVRQGLAHQCQTIGFMEGFEGLHANESTELDGTSVSEIIDRGGTILRTSRFPEFLEPKTREKAAANLRGLGVKHLIIIGGEGSMKGARALCQLGISAIGVPASIDNDIFGSDFSIGFDTALNTVIDVLRKLRDTASAHERIFVVEVMGRRSGAIALYAGLAGGADYICLPDTPATEAGQLNRIYNLVEERYREGKTHTLVIVAEGAGPATQVSEAIEAATGREVRLSVLGHMQRGGAPSAMDRILASRLGATAVNAAVAGRSDVMVGLDGDKITETPLSEASENQVSVSAELNKLAKVLA